MSLSVVIPVLIASLILTTSLTWGVINLCNGVGCGFRAVCNQDDNHCECPLSNPKGEPTYLCHTPERTSCFVTANNGLTGFSGDKTSVKFPCKYNLAKFDTALLSRKANDLPAGNWSQADPGRDRCRVIVHATNSAGQRGTFNIERVEAQISINVGGSSNLESLTVKVDANELTYTYHPYPAVTVNKNDQTDCNTIVLNSQNSIGVSLCYVDVYKIWSIGFPECGNTYISFRPWNSSYNEVLRPGVSIVTEKSEALFSDGSQFPESLCGTPHSDSGNVYESAARDFGIVSKRDVSLYSMLINNPPIQPHACIDSLTIFSFCSKEKKVQAINNCGPILTRYSFCVAKNGADALQTFATCLAAVCLDPINCPTIAKNVRGSLGCDSFKDPC